MKLTEDLLLAIVVAVMAQAAPVSPTERANDVVVVGSRESFRMSMRALRPAQSEYASHRGQFAPASRLTFLVERTAGSTDRRPARLYMSDGKHRTAIDIGSDNSFGLPSMPAGKGWLESNLTRRQMRITPLVLSPSSTRYDYRLGDARLQCRVTWAMIKGGTSILEAPIVGMIDVAGPCTDRKIGIYVMAPAPIRMATLQEDARTVPITMSTDRRSYRLQVTDQTFGNEARIKLATD